MIYENDISRLYIVTYTTKFEKQTVTEQFFLEHSETSVNAFSEDFFVHTDTYTTLEEKLSQNENKKVLRSLWSIRHGESKVSILGTR